MSDDFQIVSQPPASPAIRGARLRGGPHDGGWLTFREGFTPAGVMTVDLPTFDGEPEPYVLMPLLDDEEEIVGWEAMWLADYRPGLRLERDPEEALLRQTWGAVDRDAVLLTPPCPPGEHEWSEWRPTPRGNRVRHCPKCQVSQGSVL